MSQFNLSIKTTSTHPNHNWWQSLWHTNKPLAFTAVFALATLLITFIGFAIDSRTLLGESVWTKPAKFSISIAFYAATLIWMLPYITERPRLIRLISWGSALMLVRRAPPHHHASGTRNTKPF